MVARNSQATRRSRRRVSRGSRTRFTSPPSPGSSSVASSITLRKDGSASSISSLMRTLPARKIISVVTSPVISATPPELTANTASTAKRSVFFGARPSDSTRVSDTSVAVMLSASDEKAKAKSPVRYSRPRSPMRFGSRR